VGKGSCLKVAETAAETKGHAVIKGKTCRGNSGGCARDSQEIIILLSGRSVKKGGEKSGGLKEKEASDRKGRILRIGGGLWIVMQERLFSSGGSCGGNIFGGERKIIGP